MAANASKVDVESLLLRLLCRTLGDGERAYHLLHQAMAESQARALPTDLRRLETFAYAYVVPRLSEAVGMRGALLVLDELEQFLAERERSDFSTLPAPPPVSAPDERLGLEELIAAPMREVGELREAVRPRVRDSVVVIQPEALERARIARALLQGGCDVHAVASADSLDEAALEAVDALVFDVVDRGGIEPDLVRVRCLLRDRETYPIWLARSAHAQTTTRALEREGFAPYLVLSPTLAMRDLFGALRARLDARWPTGQ